MLLQLNNINSPLEQFSVFTIFDFFDISSIKITNIFFSFILSILFIYFLIYNNINYIYKENNKYKIFTQIYLFVKNIFKENVLVNKPFFFL